MLLALFSVRTVNLRELAVVFACDSLLDSSYKRLKRFFFKLQSRHGIIALWIFNVFFPETKKVYLIIDRTNWYWGKQKINIFMLGVTYEGLAIPLYWRLLSKAVNSNFTEQKSVLNRFFATFGTSRIVGLLALTWMPRSKLFRLLDAKKVPFYIRIKEGAVIASRIKKYSLLKNSATVLRQKPVKNFLGLCGYLDKKMYLASSRSEREELMVVATNQLPKNAIPTLSINNFKSSGTTVISLVFLSTLN